MKFLSALAFVASMVSAASAADTNGYKNARVVPDVMSEDSIAKLHDHVGTFRFLRKTGDDGKKNRHRGEASVSADDLRMLLLSIGDKRQVQDGMILRSTLVTGDTEPHRDMKVGGDKKFEEDEEVMFVFLNDNEAAYFQIGDDKIPAKAGTAVSFKGHSAIHNTVVPSGEVRLLGPISSRDLQEVEALTCYPDVDCDDVTGTGILAIGCCGVEYGGITYEGCVRQRDVQMGKDAESTTICMCTPDDDWDGQVQQEYRYEFVKEVGNPSTQTVDVVQCDNYDPINGDWVTAGTEVPP